MTAPALASTSPARRLAPPPTGDVIGVDLALVDYESALDWIDAAAETGARGYICVAATHTVTACREDPALRAAVAGSDLTVPDGQPLVWALNLLGHRLRDRVYGPELMDRACARAARTGLRMYLYGGRNQGGLAQLARELRLRHPGLQLVGGYAPPFRDLADAEAEAIAAEINAAQPDVVWVGLGVPKQEKWMASMRHRLDAAVLVGVGAAFDFHAGLVPQAPPWMQKTGLEWLFRLIQEPRRLWRRYLRYNPRFVAFFAAQLVRQRLLRR